jgi:hypothetical protein
MERALLFMACADHVVAHCPVCDRSYTRAQVGADLLGSQSHLCPTCRLDLTASIREHLLSCSAAVALEGPELRAQAVRRHPESPEASAPDEQQQRPAADETRTRPGAP